MKDERPLPEEREPGEQGRFQRFSDFARRIIAVPKAEIDQQARLHQKRMAKKKNGRPR